MTRLLAQAVAIAAKDLRVELRDRTVVNTVVPFAGTLLVLFGLAFGPGRAALRASAPALLWLAILFAGVLALRGSLEIETKDDALEQLILSPADRIAIYLGKTVAVSAQLVLLEAVTVAGAVVLFDLSPPSDAVRMVAAFAAGTIAFAALGVLFAVLSARARAREALLPLLLLPASVPVLLAGVRSTQLASSAADAGAGGWLSLLVVFALVSLACGCLVFEHLVEDA